MKKKQRNEVFLEGDPFPDLRVLDEAYQKEFGPALDALRTWAKEELEPAEKEMRKELDSLQTPD